MEAIFFYVTRTSFLCNMDIFYVTWTNFYKFYVKFSIPNFKTVNFAQKMNLNYLFL